ncbi:MAG: transketolase family protein [Candidatus Coproplasma sp.]
MGNYMTELGKIDNRVIVVNADLMGTSRNRTFVEQFPEKAFNVGIAEQNLVSFAAGLAHEGYIPFANSMSPFITMRACEQCRTDVAYGGLNVRLIGTYSGVSGGISGATHWGIEDCAIMASIPGMTVLEPSDSVQAKKMLKDSLSYKGPIYIRVSVEPQATLYEDSKKSFEFGKANILKDGHDGMFICSGVTVQYAIEAAELIEERFNKHIGVLDMPTIKPIDESAICNAAMTKHIIVAQDHNIIGGLGSMVAMVIAKNNLNTQFKILGIPDEFVPMAHAPYLYNQFSYDAEGLITEMLNMLERE